MKWLAYWKTVKQYTENLGCRLVVSKHEVSRCDSENMTIYVDATLPVKHRIYVLLHELGHYRIHNQEKAAGIPNLPHNFVDVDNDQNISKKAKVAIIREEILAWDQAQAIAETLGVPLDKGFQVLKNKLLFSYFEWAVSSKEENDY